MDIDEHGEFRRRSGSGRDGNIEIETVDIGLCQVLFGQEMLDMSELYITSNWQGQRRRSVGDVNRGSNCLGSVTHKLTHRLWHLEHHPFALQSALHPRTDS